MANTDIFLEAKYETVVILCPHCKQQSKVEAPTNQCVLSFECPNCHRAIEKTDAGCCVFCSHGGAPSCSESCE